MAGPSATNGRITLQAAQKQNMYSTQTCSKQQWMMRGSAHEPPSPRHAVQLGPAKSRVPTTNIAAAATSSFVGSAPHVRTLHDMRWWEGPRHMKHHHHNPQPHPRCHPCSVSAVADAPNPAWPSMKQSTCARAVHICTCSCSPTSQCVDSMALAMSASTLHLRTTSHDQAYTVCAKVMPWWGHSVCTVMVSTFATCVRRSRCRPGSHRGPLPVWRYAQGWGPQCPFGCLGWSRWFSRTGRCWSCRRGAA